MAKRRQDAELNEDLDLLVGKFEPKIVALTHSLIGLVRDLRPELTPKVQFGWGTINFRHPVAGFLCAVYPAREHVALIFQQGRLLDSPLLIDDGKVKQVRWIPLRPGEELPVDDIGILLAEAVALRA
jgi:hypothetical protein